jgi:hypothetical protein
VAALLMAAHAQQPRPGTEPQPVSTEAEELHRIISTSVRDMLDAYRIQARAGPVTDKALEEIIFRAAHGV